MNYLKVLTFDNQKELPRTLSEKLDKDKIGEYLTYMKSILQKKNNELVLKESYSYFDYKFNNFGFSDDGKLFAFIFNKESLVLINTTINKPICAFTLPQEIQNNIQDFVNLETRGFFKKLFSRLSFSKINQKTNNIFISDGKFLIISSRKIFFNP
jgi:hypothetical protein